MVSLQLLTLISFSTTSILSTLPPILTKNIEFICATTITATTSTEDLKPTNYPTVSIKQLVGHHKDTGVLHHTLQESDLIFPHKFLIRFLTHCSVIHIKCAATDTIVYRLERNKLAILERDIFVFQAVEKDVPYLIESPMFGRIAHKFIVTSRLITKPGKCFSVNHQTYRCDTGVNGRLIRIAAFGMPQVYRYNPLGDGTVQGIGGAHHYFLEECSRRLNFTTRVHAVFSSGAKLPNGTWTGAVRELVNNAADITIPVGIDESRNYVVGCSNVIQSFRMVFWVNGAKESQVSPKAIFRPISLLVWILLWMTLAAAAPILFYFVRHEFGDDIISVASKLSELSLRLILEQSTALRECNGTRTRMIIIMGALFSIVIGTGYKTKLYYFLTFTEGSPVPRNFDELAYSEYKLYFRFYGGVGYEHLIKSKDPMHKAMLRDNRLQLVKSSLGCIRKVFTEDKVACLDYDFCGGYAIAANTTLYYNTDSTQDDYLFKQSQDYDAHFFITWCFQKRSPLIQIINPVMSRILSAGLHGYWVNMDWNNQKIGGIRHLKSEKDSQLRTKLEELERAKFIGPSALPLATVLISVVICISMLGFSTGIFAVEILWNDLKLRIMKR